MSNVTAINTINGNSTSSWTTLTDFTDDWQALIPTPNKITQQYVQECLITGVQYDLVDSNTATITVVFNSQSSYNSYRDNSNNAFVTILTDNGWSRSESVE